MRTAPPQATGSIAGDTVINVEAARQHLDEGMSRAQVRPASR
ncbi:hypothetical protein [Amycolatopsis nigrescens]|nr:hypothetical protein [Amycolatopsis nigrescens]